MAPLSDEEIKLAAFQLGSSKAPGPDGFNGKFYQSSWGTVGPQVRYMAQEFFNGLGSLHQLNERNLVLIPKTDKAELVTQFRPIGLCNFSYKVISKVLANRMKPLLDSCISSN